MKQQRQKAILDIVARTPVSSQGDIVAALARAGIAANQATVSRDIHDLGLIKIADPVRGHRYAVPTAPLPRRRDDLTDIFREHVTRVDGSDTLIVLKTPPAHAHLVGVAIDGLGEDAIVGTVAGDDTVLVVPRTDGDRRALMARFAALVPGARPVR